LATTSGDNTSRIWNARTGDELVRLPHADDVHYAAFSPDGRWLATTGRDKITRIWDAFSGTELLHIKLKYSADQVAFSPDGTILAVNPLGIRLYRIVVTS
jgi:WD40 repeat protein